MDIRIAIDIDIPVLARLSERYYKEVERFTNLSYDADRAMYFGALSIPDPNQQIFIACEGREIIGFMWVVVECPVWSKDVIAHDIMLYVSPEHRNLFTAKKLIEAVEKWARVCGAKVVHCGANSGIMQDRAARALYKHSGYLPGGYNFYKELQEE